MNLLLPKKGWISVQGYTYLYGGSNLVLEEGWLCFTCEVICCDDVVRSGSQSRIMVPLTQVLMIQSYEADWTKGTTRFDGSPIPFKKAEDKP